MVVTSIVKQKSSSSRYNIYIDNNYCFSADYDDIVSLEIKENTYFDEESLQKVIYKCQYNKAYNKALRILSARSISEHELRKKLKVSSFDSRIIDGVLIRLKELNYINDDEYARLWVEERKKFKPSGKRRLIQELGRKGIEAELVNNVMNELEYDDLQAALNILNNKLKAMNRTYDIKEFNKLYRLLLYRGIGYDTAHKALRMVLGDHRGIVDAE